MRGFWNELTRGSGGGGGRGGGEKGKRSKRGVNLYWY